MLAQFGSCTWGSCYSSANDAEPNRHIDCDAIAWLNMLSCMFVYFWLMFILFQFKSKLPEKGVYIVCVSISEVNASNVSIYQLVDAGGMNDVRSAGQMTHNTTIDVTTFGIFISILLGKYSLTNIHSSFKPFSIYVNRFAEYIFSH